MGGVVEDLTRKGEISSSNPTCRETCDFMRKIARLATFVGLNFFSYFQKPILYFLEKYFYRPLAKRAVCGNLFWLREPPVKIYFLQTVLSYPPVEKFISTGLQRRRFAEPPIQTGYEPSV